MSATSVLGFSLSSRRLPDEVVDALSPWMTLG